MEHKLKIALVLILGMAVATAARAESIWIAAVAHTPGDEGTRWRSDVAVLNLCPIDVEVELVLHHEDGLVSADFVIPAGGQQIFEDVVAQLTAGDVTGALEVRANGGIVVTSRTYNRSEVGTFGQALAGVTASESMTTGDEVLLPQLREDSGFRTNIGALNMGDDKAKLQVTLYDTTGSLVGEFMLRISAGLNVQDNRPFRDRFGLTDIVGGYAIVTVESGSSVTVYASVVDNATGDPTTVQPEARPGCSVDLADRLRAIDGMTVEELPTSLEGYRFFSLHYDQPADHAQPDGATFPQAMTLLHRDAEAPMVLVTRGYGNPSSDSRTELAQVLDANQLSVEHRFFNASTPLGGDWELLTIEQAAADHHRIVEAIKPLYTGVWISTGASKGGMTATYHRRFYPEDVDATVPYVAPISFGAPDDAYLGFLATRGTASCRNALSAVQREVLERRESMISLINDRYGDLSYDRVGGLDRALEMVTIELPFGFWQYSGESYCSQIPSTTASDVQVFDFMDDFVGWYFASDFIFDYYDPYFYQAQTQLGYPAVARDHLADLLQTDVPDLEEGLPPEGTDPTYDPAVMIDIAQWLSDQGERFLFIYGGNDAWTGGAFDIGDATDSYVFVDPGGTHGAHIGSLDPADRDQVLGILSRWAGVEAHQPAAKTTTDRFPYWRPGPPPFP